MPERVTSAGRSSPSALKTNRTCAVGYLTLYVLRLLSVHPNDDPQLELLLLQHADIYDEDTRLTTKHLRDSFSFVNTQCITFPKEQASDFTLLAAYAAASTSSEFHLSNDVLTRLRSDVLTYVDMLERLAATACTSSLHELLASIQISTPHDIIASQQFSTLPLPHPTRQRHRHLRRPEPTPRLHFLLHQSQSPATRRLSL